MDDCVAAVAAAVAAYRHRKQRIKNIAHSVLSLEYLGEEEGKSSQDDGHEVKRQRRVFQRPDYTQSPWAVMLRHEGLQDSTSRESKVFRRRFRIPHVFFLELVDLVKARKWFCTKEVDISGRMCIPVELKVLSALQVLGRGNFFDDVSQLFFMSELVAQASFHVFCKNFAAELYDNHIYRPTGEALKKVMRDYHSFTRKEGFPTIAYQVTVDHTGRVLAVTEGFPGAQNDKTIIRYDAAVKSIREDPAYTEAVFHLRDATGCSVECKGAYLIVDNGYHKWRVTQEPTKYPLNRKETNYSKALESVRKDVECFFGIVKGRFRILKLPALYHKKESIDNVFFTCYILHNMLHAYDGLDKLEEDVDWAGGDGLHDSITDPSVTPATDCSSVGDPSNNESVEVEPSHDDLKRKLITSFTYRKEHNGIVWLTR